MQVRTLLETSGVSQAQAARQLGLSTKHMSQMLTGRAGLSLERAEEILGLCGMALVISVQPVQGRAQ
ncbi:helix-turn-helix domain-containing protein [Streptomyces sp. NPDC015346]|uniref:helix-turn-helix domain-containing protein n=1 Tax=Streptomyces sp. NPDC015346 TaxID=3364954 RepID=UPI0036FDD8B9